jgi:phosphinothricin acetyltransferase
MDDMAAWFAAKETGGHPMIGAFEDDGTLAGFASFGTFRAWPAYKYSIEHSIYIRADKRGAGLGKLLLSSLIRLAEEKGYHMMIGGIDSSNEASVRLHRSLGFTHCASIRQAGYKFGRWLDLEFYQLLLPGPDEPDEK